MAAAEKGERYAPVAHRVLGDRFVTAVVEGGALYVTTTYGESGVPKAVFDQACEALTAAAPPELRITVQDMHEQGPFCGGLRSPGG